MKPYVHGASRLTVLQRAVAELNAENRTLRNRLHKVTKKRKPDPDCKATMTPDAYERALHRNYAIALTSYTPAQLQAGSQRLKQATAEAATWDAQRRTTVRKQT